LTFRLRSFGLIADQPTLEGREIFNLFINRTYGKIALFGTIVTAAGIEMALQRLLEGLCKRLNR
jgi:hypothetical protein